MKIKKGDLVLIIAGKDKGKKAKVLESFPQKGKVVVEDHVTDDRKVMCLAAMTGSMGVYLDGVRGLGHPVDEQQARQMIDDALRRRADSEDAAP